ncbi:MAG: 4-(cytidine 5'-diphospho)-2-C-methyl-D-erythritol kinase [Treponema sp.]|nr:4-(cytidine 5'-diphospho)-2-C-methyl-D-erythritol kinase [Treponema sp.]
MPRELIDAPAKLNLSLRIKDRRPDGFHNIESLFLALAFGDTLCVETAGSPSSLEICMNWQIDGLQPAIIPPSELPPDKNIISRAVSLFRNSTGYTMGLKITVTKRIPLGGGLGGGSSDAAATLLALTRLASSDGCGDICGFPSNAALAGMGADLGSDVPFFLHCRSSPAAWVTGRGECVQPVELPDGVFDISFVLVNPGFPSDTAQAFRQWDISRDFPAKMQIPDFSTQVSVPFFGNDFLPVLSAYRDEYGVILSSLNNLGADYSGLSGSGSTCFGVFSNQKKAIMAKVFFMKRFSNVFITFPLRVKQTDGTIRNRIVPIKKRREAWRSLTLEYGR